MTEQFLDAADIHSAQEEMGGITVAEGMGRDLARDPGALDGAGERAADPLLMLMMAAHQAGPGIKGRMVRGENPEPRPGNACSGIFHAIGPGQMEGCQARGTILRVEQGGPGKLVAEGRKKRLRQGDDAVFPALSIPHLDFPPLDIHILHAQAEQLHDAEAAAIEKPRLQGFLPIERAEQALDLLRRQYHREMAALLGPRR